MHSRGTASARLFPWVATAHLSTNSAPEIRGRKKKNFTPFLPNYFSFTMARQRRSAPVQRTQTRSAHTAAAPQHYQQQPSHVAQPVQQQLQQGPGLFGQMASTAAGVAVGSTIGHTLGAGITSMFGGSSAPAQPVEQQVAPQQQQQNYQQQAGRCEADASAFTRCLTDNGGDMQICDFYLQQLKACQEASRHY
jgi:hypothetical protein